MYIMLCKQALLEQWYNPLHTLMALISNIFLGQKILHEWNKMYTKEFASKVQPADGQGVACLHSHTWVGKL